MARQRHPGHAVEVGHQPDRAGREQERRDRQPPVEEGHRTQPRQPRRPQRLGPSPVVPAADPADRRAGHDREADRQRQRQRRRQPARRIARGPHDPRRREPGDHPREDPRVVSDEAAGELGVAHPLALVEEDADRRTHRSERDEVGPPEDRRAEEPPLPPAQRRRRRERNDVVEAHRHHRQQRHPRRRQQPGLAGVRHVLPQPVVVDAPQRAPNHRQHHERHHHRQHPPHRRPPRGRRLPPSRSRGVHPGLVVGRSGQGVGTL